MLHDFESLMEKFNAILELCQQGLAAERDNGSSYTNVDRLRTIAGQIDGILPFMVGSHLRQSDAENMLREFQKVDWVGFDRQCLVSLANSVRESAAGIKEGNAFEKQLFAKLLNAVQQHDIYDWQLLGVTYVERRIWQRLADSDISPYDIRGWQDRLAMPELAESGQF